jgi:hypothetical protein
LNHTPIPRVNNPAHKLIDGEGAEFGYMSMSNEFVFEGDTSDVPYPGFLTLIYTGGVDLAVFIDNEVSSLSNHMASYVLSDPNPLNPSVFEIADLTFLTALGPAELILNASVDPTTGGFSPIPEPSTLLLLASFGLVAAFAWRRHHPLPPRRGGLPFRSFTRG